MKTPEQRNADYKYKDLIDAAKDFIEKVDTGRARSTDSYNKFKRALIKVGAIKP